MDDIKVNVGNAFDGAKYAIAIQLMAVAVWASWSYAVNFMG